MPNDWHNEVSGSHPETGPQLATLLYVAAAAGYPVRDIVVLVVISAGVTALRRWLD
jgi:hypothetical protein